MLPKKLLQEENVVKTGCDRRMERSFRNAPVVSLYPHSKIVLFSDCHRGVGNTNDNFMKNQHLYIAALRYYYTQGFVYIELGDGDELWENRSFAAIREIHSDVFRLFTRFKKERRLYLLYGNHDCALKDDREFCRYAGVVLKICGFKAHEEEERKMDTHCLELYLTHGNQADILNSTFWKLSRFLVRYLWKPLEQFGVLDPTSAAKNYRCRTKNERRLSRWAIENDCYLITGHTHRPVLGGQETRYFNTGSCVHPYCITCMEIESGRLSLIKWNVGVKPDSSLYVSREVLAGPLALDRL